MLSFKGSRDHALSRLKGYRTAGSGSVKTGVPTESVSNRRFAQGQVIFTQPQFYSPLHTPQNWQIPSKRREVYQWCRYFTENEPKVGAAIDFYSSFPMNGFETVCPNSKVKRFFDAFNKKINFDKWNPMISQEVYMLGDVFPFLELDCKKCNGTSMADGRICNHEGAIYRRLVILNPDWIDVQQNAFSDEPVITLLPDEELKRVVWYKQPAQIYNRIPKHIQALVLANQAIPLSNESASHLAYRPSPYGGGYGTSLVRRLFKMLTYKDKLMTAQWIVAERLILPVRIVKVGNDERPAGPADIADVQAQIAQVTNDPNLTLVTHHAFDYDWVGASGKILQLTNEYDLLNKEILQGLTLNDALLSGEMAGYQSAAIGAEALIQRIESWRTELARWIEESIYKPIAKWQGFIDEEATKEYGEELGEEIYVYPKIQWNDLNIRDTSNDKQIFMQLHDKQIMSSQTLCEKMDLDYDQEVERLRFESAQMQFGQEAQMAAGGAGGGMPMGGGGAPPMGGEMPPPEGDMGMPGGELGAPGGEMGAPPPGAAAGGGTEGKIMTKSHAEKKQLRPAEEQQAQPSGTRLTSLEQIMYKTLMTMDMPFQRFAQYPLGQYRVDFAIPTIRLAIECDGDQWHGAPEAKAHDKSRDMKLANAGWTVVRFGESELKENLSQVRQSLASQIHKSWKLALEAQKAKGEQIEQAAASIEALVKVAENQIDEDGVSESPGEEELTEQ
jgi:very-short-patch-repair endonuclease